MICQKIKDIVLKTVCDF